MSLNMCRGCVVQFSQISKTVSWSLVLALLDIRIFTLKLILVYACCVSYMHVATLLSQCTMLCVYYILCGKTILFGQCKNLDNFTYQFIYSRELMFIYLSLIVMLHAYLTKIVVLISVLLLSLWDDDAVYGIMGCRGVLE